MSPHPLKPVAELKSCKKSVELYLRALWGEGFYLKHITQDVVSPLSYLIDRDINLPEKITLDKISINYYRASSVHASLHAIYSDVVFEVGDLNLMQRMLIGLVEDLRIELLAIKKFPGLRNLWLEFHQVSDETNSAMSLMIRLSRSVLDSEYVDKSQWVEKGRKLIISNEVLFQDARISKTIGLSLANDLGQMRMPLNSGMYEQGVIYRDDNRCLWVDIKESREKTSTVTSGVESDVQQKRLKESLMGTQLRFSEDINSQGEGFVVFDKEIGALEYNKSRSKVVESKFVYPEWDYRSHVLKENWCNISEIVSEAGAECEIENIFLKHKVTLNRLRYIAKKLQIEKKQRKKNLTEGDDIDLDAVIGAMVSMRSGETPDPRVFMRDESIHIKSVAISVLLDLSESINKSVNGSNISIAELMRDSVILLGETLSIAGEEYAISGFSSNGRHDVKFTKFKKFGENFNECRDRLVNVKGEYSTRLGAAIRHAGLELRNQVSMKKLLLVITDGVPSDIDVYDERYLEYDSWHAVKALDKDIQSFCINLDSGSTPAIEHMFGRGRFTVMEDIARLPDVLSEVYIRYAHH